jgi:hypothetical protein
MIFLLALFWFACSIATIHIDMLVNGTESYRENPSDVWIISAFGPFCLVFAILEAIEKAGKARRRGLL